MNKIELEGRSVREIACSYTKTGRPYARFIIAASDKYKDEVGEWKERNLIYMNCIAFGYLAEMLAGCKQGKLLRVEGVLKRNKYTGRDGNKREEIQVLVRRISVPLRNDTSIQEPSAGRWEETFGA